MKAPFYADPHAELYHGDSLALMAEMEADSVDAIVTDPPYGLNFMGREWDHGVPATPFWAEMYRVAKPGAHLLAFGGTRTMHRITGAIEDAGWEIRDMLAWCYAEGFPKGPDVGRQIDVELCKLPGRHWMRSLPPEPQPEDHICPETPEGRAHYGESTTLKPAWEPIVLARKPMRTTVATSVRERGTGALQIDATRLPIHPDDPVNEATWTSRESAIREGTTGFVTSNSDGERHPARPQRRETLTRKPSVVADDAPAGFGRGKAMGGGSVRVPQSDPANRTGVVGRDLGFSNGDAAKMQEAQQRSTERLEELGRWPSNVILTDPIFDGGWDGVEGGGIQRGGGNPPTQYDDGSGSPIYGTGWRTGPTGKVPVDTWGSYSRFFLVPKAARTERERGLGGGVVAPVANAPNSSARMCINCGSKRIEAAQGGEHVCRPGCPEKKLVFVPIQHRPRANQHPTVKPIELMRHLVRLVTPPGGIVLDPFLGSGTTALAASEEGRRCIGIEQQEEYLVTSVGRLTATPIGLGL